MIPIDAEVRANKISRSTLVVLALIATLVGGVGGCRNTAQPEAAPTEAAVAPGEEWLPLEVVVATRLNVRAGPGTEYDIVGALIQGEQVRVLEESNGWKLVRPDSDGLEGWVSAEFLESLPTP